MNRAPQDATSSPGRASAATRCPSLEDGLPGQARHDGRAWRGARRSRRVGHSRPGHRRRAAADRAGDLLGRRRAAGRARPTAWAPQAMPYVIAVGLALLGPRQRLAWRCAATSRARELDSDGRSLLIVGGLAAADRCSSRSARLHSATGAPVRRDRRRLRPPRLWHRPRHRHRPRARRVPALRQAAHAVAAAGPARAPVLRPDRWTPSTPCSAGPRHRRCSR